MTHHLFDIESPFQREGMTYWPYANHHSPNCNCAAMREYRAEHTRRREWDEAVAAERQRQIEKGFDQAHDEAHGIEHLLTWAAEYARRGEHVKGWAIIEAARELRADREPQPGDGPDYHADHAAWVARTQSTELESDG